MLFIIILDWSNYDSTANTRVGNHVVCGRLAWARMNGRLARTFVTIVNIRGVRNFAEGKGQDHLEALERQLQELKSDVGTEQLWSMLLMFSIVLFKINFMKRNIMHVQKLEYLSALVVQFSALGPVLTSFSVSMLILCNRSFQLRTGRCHELGNETK